jgi:hypothetical protein
MMKVEGYVQKIETLQTKTGKTMYNVRVNGDKFGAGMYAPRFKEGDFIAFDATLNGNFKNMETRTVTVKAPPANAPAFSPQMQTVGPKTGNSPDWDARQDVISKQAALNSAQHMVEILVTVGGVPGLDKAKTPADKLQVITDLCTEFTKDFYHQNTGKTLELPSTSAPAEAGTSDTKMPDGWE